jgi:hypothetical protein
MLFNKNIHTGDAGMNSSDPFQKKSVRIKKLPANIADSI